MATSDNDISIEEAIAKTGGSGWYQTKLLLKTLPLGWTFVFGVSTVAFIMPAIVCEFAITKYQQGLIYSAVYFGMMPFGVIWGGITDVLGRRNTLLVATGLAGVFEFLASFSTGYRMLFICKILSGCATSGVHLTYYIYLNEFVDAQSKDEMIVLTGGAAAFGYFLQPLLAAALIPLKTDVEPIFGLFKIYSWQLFVILCAMPPIVGFFVCLFTMSETPKYLLIQNRPDESLKILQDIYSTNTRKPADTFPVKRLRLEELQEKETNRIPLGTRLVQYVKPLFQYPNFIPVMMAFAAQLITMGSYNTVRQHMPTLFGLALGIGQLLPKNITQRYSQPQNVDFCVLFESQEVFSAHVDCHQEDIHLDYKLFLCSAFVGFIVFISFVPVKAAVVKIGKVHTFLGAHIVSAIAISYFPYSKAYSAVAIMTIYSVCMQNCLTIALGLMITRVPANIRGLTVSLIMLIGRLGVVIGNQVLPIITNISCYFGFWTIAGINLTAIPIMFVYYQQPNPYEEKALKLSLKAREEK